MVGIFCSILTNLYELERSRTLTIAPSRFKVKKNPIFIMLGKIIKFHPYYQTSVITEICKCTIRTRGPSSTP